jgi:hypothetical protein
VVADPRSNWVQRQVARDLEKVAFGLDCLRVEPVLEEMALETLAPVKPLRVAAVQPVHSRRKCRFLHLEREMEMVGHEAIREALPLLASNREGQQREEPPTAVLVDKDVCGAVAARGDVEDAAGHVVAR